MGRKVHIDGVRRFIRGTPAFRARDVELQVGDRGYALLLLHNLEKGGEVHRVTRGWYSASEDPTVCVFPFAPAYLGLQEALSVRGLWDQESNVVVVTSGMAKPGTRTLLGSRVVVHRIAPRYFFGFDHLPYDGYSVPVSDAEKTLIDLVYYDELPGQDVLEGIWSKADKQVLRRYLSRYPPGFRSAFEKAVGRGLRAGVQAHR